MYIKYTALQGLIRVRSRLFLRGNIKGGGVGPADPAGAGPMSAAVLKIN